MVRDPAQVQGPLPPRLALVTGASRGIGAAISKLLASEGYRLALLARNPQALAETAAELRGEGHRVIPCDLTDPGAIRQAVGRVAEEFGSLDLVVNNAGVGCRARIEELDPEIVASVFDTNVTGLLLLCREVLPLLRLGRDPVLINVASVVGRRGIPGQAAYSASKAAVCSIGEALRIEWAPDGIAVCTLNPALTATGFFDAQPNPADLPHPDLSNAAPAEDVARWVLDLDRNPRPEVSLRWKWRMLAILSVLWPRLADRLLVKRLGGSWRIPKR